MAIAGWVGALTGSPVWLAGLAYKTIVGICDLGSVLLMYRVIRNNVQTDDGAGVRGLALFALNPLLAWEIAGQGHNDGFIVFAGVIYLWATQRGRDAAAVSALAIGTLAKLALAPSIALDLWAVARRNRVRALLFTLLVLGLAAAAYAPEWNGPDTLKNWMLPLHQDSTRVQHGNSLCTSLWKVLRILHASDATVSLALASYAWVGRLFVLAIAVMLFRRVKGVSDVASASLILLLALLATSGVLLPWYVTWILPFAAVEKDVRWQHLTLAVTGVSSLALGAAGMNVLLAVCQVAVVVAVLRWSPTLRGLDANAAMAVPGAS
jgi:hypothetical protein